MTFTAPQTGSNAVSPEYYTLSGTLSADHQVNFTNGANIARALRVATAGDVELVDSTGATVIVPGVTPGELLQVLFSEIKSANTTAQDITVFR